MERRNGGAKSRKHFITDNIHLDGKFCLHFRFPLLESSFFLHETLNIHHVVADFRVVMVIGCR